MISLRHLYKSFGNVRAVDALSLEVGAGELFCFLGPNGAGKTTTIKMITSLVHPDAGEIEIAGVDAIAHPVEAKRRLGYISDMPYLYDRLSPMEFLYFTGDLYQMPHHEVRERAREQLTIFGMMDKAHVLTRDLSHGMRQRVIYAATLMHNPRVLLVDEPFIGLDPHSIRLIKNLLREHTRKGMTVLMTTHILAIAEEIADRIGIIDRGRMVACGTLDELRAHHSSSEKLEDLFLHLTK